MSVEVEKDWIYKKVRSESASRSAFAYKINKMIKEKARQDVSYGHGRIVGYSREVIVKVTGGARNKRGIKRGVEYISKEWKEELIDSNGIVYKTKEEMESAARLLQENVIENSMSRSGRGAKITHNITFSAPRIAEVRKEDGLEAARATIREKYPDNYFVMAYHVETKNPHVHVILNIHKDTGEKIDIRKQDLREIREGFCKNLTDYGYEVKATRKYGYKEEEYKELITRENRNIYEIVDFGSASYQLDGRNQKSNYLKYKTTNEKEVTIWGASIIEEVIRNNIRIGDKVKINKMGEEKIKVPMYGKDDKTIERWKETKRNKWSIEKVTTDNVIKLGGEYHKEIKLDMPEQYKKQLAQKERFEEEKKLYLNPSYEKKYELEHKMQIRQKY